jgi:hypothetical protein
MTVSDLLEQPCNKSDNINKVVTTVLKQLVPNLVTTWNKPPSVNTTCWQTDILACINGDNYNMLTGLRQGHKSSNISLFDCIYRARKLECFHLSLHNYI